MKIAIIVYNFPPRWLAGTEIATYQTAEELARLGHEVHVITQLDKGLPPEDYEKGFYVRRLSSIKIRVIDRITFWAKVPKIIGEINPDIIHAQGLVCGFPALISGKLLNVPYVAYGRGSDVYLQDISIKLTIKAVLKKASAVIALTEDMKVAMQSFHHRDVIVIPNGISLVNKINIPRERNNSSKVILFVGRLDPVKGTEYLLYAMSTVHKKIPETRLMLVGDGSERRELENLAYDLKISGCVEFVGMVAHERVSEFMHNADILVLPSLSEGFPVTILEAMACGLPIIATRVGGLQEIIEEGINGNLVEVKNPEEIAEKLIALIQNDAMRENMSARNTEKARQYSWKKVVASIEEVYKKMIVKHSEEH